MELMIGFIAGVVCTLSGVAIGVMSVKPKPPEKVETEVTTAKPVAPVDIMDEWLHGPKGAKQ